MNRAKEAAVTGTKSKLTVVGAVSAGMIAGFIAGVNPLDNTLDIADPIPAVVYEEVKKPGHHPYPHMRTSIDSLPAGQVLQVVAVCNGEMVARDEFTIPEAKERGWRISGVVKASFNANPPHDTSKAE